MEIVIIIDYVDYNIIVVLQQKHRNKPDGGNPHKKHQPKALWVCMINIVDIYGIIRKDKSKCYS